MGVVVQYNDTLQEYAGTLSLDGGSAVSWNVPQWLHVLMAISGLVLFGQILHLEWQNLNMSHCFSLFCCAHAVK
jgi:hypothetical protein